MGRIELSQVLFFLVAGAFAVTAHPPPRRIEAQFTKDEFSHGFEFEGGEFKTVWVKRLMGDSRGGSILALKTCTDTTSITVKQGTKVVGKGRKAEESYFFGNTPRGLAIVAAQNVEVSTC